MNLSKPFTTCQSFCLAPPTVIKMQVIDSCATKNGGCDHKCVHGVGGPVCSCHAGYQLQADGKTCQGKRIILKYFKIF